MSVKGYTIISVATKLVTDLYENNPAPGTVIQVFPINQQPSGTTNQQVSPHMSFLSL